jgi:hypothetical protein
MTKLENRIHEIAKAYNVGNATWLTKMTLNAKRIKKAINLGLKVSDEDIHQEVYYYEEEYNGDCFEDAAFGTNFTGTNP